jgi:hypothetical protein
MKKKMHKQNENLENLIADYLSLVEAGTALLEKKLGFRNILRLWRTSQITRCGNITADIEYELHGIGCAIYFPNESVDFDYGPDDRIDGFDAWRLYIFAKDRPEKYQKFCDQEVIENELREYIKNNKITKMPHPSNLYSLIDKNKADCYFLPD